MRILLDTNILIPLEDSKVLDQKIAAINRLANKYHCNLLCHPGSVADLQRDSDSSRRSMVLSKLHKYDQLIPPGDPDEAFLDILGEVASKPNDIIDNLLLYAIYRDSVNFLVTEDRGIHKKAKRLGVDSKVYTIEQCIDALTGLFEKKPIFLPNVEEVPVYTLSLKDPIFASLRDDYGDFDNWFRNISSQNRKAWAILKDDESLGAVMIYKEEENDGRIPIQAKELLKMCTFKVSEEFRGRKIGELFLKACFNYCTQNNIKGTYLTTIQGKQQELVNLLLDYGFSCTKYDDREDAIYRSFLPPEKSEGRMLSPLDFHIKYYPYFKSGPEVNKFIVPVIPPYHETLFPDCQAQVSLFNPNEAVNNGILKAYLCNSKIKKVRSGDLLLFYRSHDWKSVTTLGIVETVFKTADPNQVAAAVSKRTVYSFKEIEQISKKEALVLLFRQITHLSTRTKFHALKASKIINNNLETITQISNEGFKTLITP